MSPKKKRRLDAANFGDTDAAGSSQVFNIGHLTADSVLLHRAPTQKEGLVEPCSNVPFPRDPNFVGRENVLDSIEGKLNDVNSHQRLALYGIGGVGKSQIVIEYTYRKRLKSPEIWIFWIYCNQPKDFVQSYQNIAHKIRLPESESATADDLDRVLNWLDDKRNGPWLIILDNVDDSSVLQEHLRGPDQRSLLSYIPTSAWGKVLSTSRDRVSAYNLTGDYNRLIPIEQMGGNESILLLESRLQIPDEHQSAAAQLVEALDHIPLAISQAGSYIREMEPMTIADYVKDLLYADEENQTLLLSKEIKDLRRHESVSSAVLRTWQISFVHIRERFPDTADLLSLLCLFHRQDIQERVIVEDTSSSQRTFRECASKLKNYSLISVTGDWTISMHRLVQLATRAWLQDQGAKTRYQCRAIRLLDKLSPCDIYLQQHFDELADAQPADEHTSLCLSRNLHVLAWRDWVQGRYESGFSRAQRSSEIRRRYQDPYHSNILSNIWLQGMCRWDAGKKEEALSRLKEYTEALELTKGKAHLGSLRAREQLANLHFVRGSKDEAEAHFSDIYRTLKDSDYQGLRIFSLRIMDQLLGLYGILGRYSSHKKLKEEVSRLKERVEDHKRETP